MNMIKIGSTVKTGRIEALIPLSTYPKNDEGATAFFQRLGDLFADKSLETKEAIKAAGGYKAIIDLADIHFEAEFSTVNFVTRGFHTLCRPDLSVKVKGDSGNYRARVMGRYNEEYENFAYPSDFLTAYNLVSLNAQLVMDEIRKEKK